jgi:hypothetical protein
VGSELAVRLVSLIVGLLGRHWFTLYATHPKLVVTGSGGWASFVRLANLHSYFGVRPKYLHVRGHTLIRGDRILGEVVERRTTKAAAWMRDRENPKRVLGMVFRVGEEYEHRVAIGIDGVVDLMLFSLVDGDQQSFKLFEPPGRAAYGGEPVMFDSTQTHHFDVTVRYSGRTRPKTFAVKVEPRPGAGGPTVWTPDCFYGPRDRPR